jgi:DNA primase
MSTAQYRIDFDDIKRAISMEAVISFLMLSGLKQKGARQWKGTCPFCKAVDCFVITGDGGRDKTGAFNCFKCPAGGDQIELVSLTRGNPRKDAKGSFAAAKELHERFLMQEAAPANRSVNTSPQPQRERRQGFDAEAYAKGLDPVHEALKVLGIDAETYRTWKAGFANAGVNRGRLALPVATKDGTIIGYMGRALSDESPTLTFPNGLVPQDHIFGIDRVTGGQLYLVRDPIEVLKAFEAGIENVVSFLTEGITAQQLEGLASLMDERLCEHVELF